jgi:DNA-binding MarR family transcriptional regulator
MPGGLKTSRLGRSELATSLGFLLRLANGVAQGELSSRLSALGLRQSLFSVLLIIQENPGLRQQEVGQTLSIQQPNLVALVNQLIAEGLITRTINAQDRRSYSLYLTTTGERRLAEANRAHSAHERRLAEAVSPMSIDAFRAVLLRLLELSEDGKRVSRVKEG